LNSGIAINFLSGRYVHPLRRNQYAAAMDPTGPLVRRVAFVVGTSEGGTGRHVRMLAAGCAARGTSVSVCAPAVTDTRAGFTSLPGVVFTPVEFGDRPRPRDVLALLRLRRALRTAGPGVVHAHGMRAGALAAIALGRVRGRRGPAFVVTVHNAPPAGGGVPALIYRLLERLVAHGADLVLCVSSDLDERMRAAGAREVARAVVPAPAPATSLPGARAAGRPAPVTGSGRPMVFAAGRLAAQKGFDTLLAAAASWRDMDPEPLLVIAGDGPLAARLRAAAAAAGVAAHFLGHRDDVPEQLAAAAVFVLPSVWEGQPLVLQEALRAGVPIVASRAGGIPDLTGGDAAVLVPPGDATRLAAAVRSVLTDPALAARLRAAARSRAARLPDEDDAVDAALACYAKVLR
jgi:glycosyltransferase involved in cell wall biosynthesis